jgi:hypothetical protein
VRKHGGDQGNTVQTAVMMAKEQVFGPERELFDEVINTKK